MKPIDLTKVLKKYKSGWVALSKKNYKVVAHADSFSKIMGKVKERKDIVLMPASEDYFGIVALIDDV